MKRRYNNCSRASALQIALSFSLILIGTSLLAAFSQLNGEAGPSPEKSQPAQADSARLFAKLTPATARTPLPLRQLSLAERVAYQYAIEEVYWRHRIWPKENQAPKPPLDEVMSPQQIEQKVKTYLRSSQLLASEWQKPITPEQLQAEMNRMASRSKQPEVLREIFSALGNDPALIAECLARAVLAERLVRELHARDQRFHGELKRRAESDLRAHSGVRQMKRTSGIYTEMEWIKSDDTDSAPREEGNAGAVRMTSSEWNESIEKLGAQFGRTVNGGARPQLARCGEGAPQTGKQEALGRIKTGVMTSLQEDDARYYATGVLEKSKDRLRLATVSWEKEPLESGAGTTEPKNPGGSDEAISDYQLPEMAAPSRENPAVACTNDTWTAPSTTKVLSGRLYHTMVWTGTEMIAWGGHADMPLNTGVRYNPSTDSWTATSTNNVPTARESHTAVWTGTEMIVWGGYGDGYLATGGRYNPGADGWTATSTVSAPANRYNHTAVWTGSEMIVWGGRANGPLNSGGRYNPNADSWLATSITNTPTPRDGHTAVWTGSEMIVWGASTDNTGGRYDPVADNWIATSIIDAPAPRFGHTAVWTGSEMIVWGGPGGGSQGMNTGGRYNPNADTWRATSTANAPGGRSYHTAIWTGTEMIIWGGGRVPGGSPWWDTGGRYHPATDWWSGTSINNAPAGRWFHTAVWTGSEMIVWGGLNASVGYLSSGGRYCAQPPPPVGTFVEGINANGNAVTVNGNPWLSHASALASGFSTNNSTFSDPRTYLPPVDADTNTMLGTGIWCSGCDVTFSQTLPNDRYEIYLWMIEDWQANYRSANLFVQGVHVAGGVGGLPLYNWQRYGPYPTTVVNGVLSVRLAVVRGDPVVQGIEIWTASPTPTPTPTPTPATTPTPPPPGSFVKGINVNGNAVTVNGNTWLSDASARADGFTAMNPTFSDPGTYLPPVDAETNTMLGTGIWCSGCDVTFSQTLSNASYDIYLWMIEDWRSNYRSVNVFMQGVQVASGIGQLPLYNWQRYGPYRATVSNGALKVMLTRVTGDPLVQGIEIWAAGTGATPTPTPTPTAAPTATPTLTQVEAVNLPVATVNTAVTNFTVNVTTSEIDPKIHGDLQALQGDFTYDSTVVSFQAIAASAGDVMTNNGASWAIATNPNFGNFAGPIKVFRIAAFCTNFVSLSTDGAASNTLFKLNLVRVSDTLGANTALTWQAPRDNRFRFFDTEGFERPLASTPPGSITVVQPTPTPTPTPSPTSNWSSTDSLSTARDGHTETLLANGKVLVAGGSNPAILSSAELYCVGLGFDPARQPLLKPSRPRLCLMEAR